MINKKHEKDTIEIKQENMDDITQYGEFVSSYFAWLTLEKQKNNTERLEKMTEKKELKNN